MAVLKIYKEFKYWDVIDSLYKEEKIENYRTTIDLRKNKKEPPNIIKIIKNSYKGKIKRTYCKCGYVAGNTDKDVCPKCGNDNLIEFNDVIRDIKSIFAIAPLVEVEEGKTYPIILKTTRYIYYDDTSSSDFVFIKETVVDYKIYEDEVITTMKSPYSPNNFDLNKIRSLYKGDPNNDFDLLPEYKSVSTFLNFINAKKRFPVISKNIKKIPYITKYVLDTWDHLHEIELIKDLSELYSDVIKCPKNELIPYIDKLYKNEFRRYFSYSGYIDEISPFTRYNEIKTNALRKAIDNLVIHGEDLTVTSLKKIIESILRLSPDENLELIIADYIRRNYSIYKNSVIDYFIEDKKFLESNGYTVSIPNLDTRNLNIIKNMSELTKRGYNPKRINFFLEMFNINPLESLVYLNSKRVPTKEMLKELKEKLD